MSEYYECRCKKDANLCLTNNETGLLEELFVKAGTEFNYYRLGEHWVVEKSDFEFGEDDIIYWISSKDRNEFFEPMPVIRTQIKSFTSEEECNKFLCTIEPDSIKSIERASTWECYTVCYDCTISRTWEEVLQKRG